jgi:hypothetical protein
MTRHLGWRLVAVLLVGVAGSMVVSGPARLGVELPCRVVCQCGWASAAGEQTSVLLQLKGHLEDCLHNGARLMRRHHQPPWRPPTMRADS